MIIICISSINIFISKVITGDHLSDRKKQEFRWCCALTALLIRCACLCLGRLSDIDKHLQTCNDQMAF